MGSRYWPPIQFSPPSPNGALPMRLARSPSACSHFATLVIAADDPWKLDDKLKIAKPDDLKDAASTSSRRRARSCSSTARTSRSG